MNNAYIIFDGTAYNNYMLYFDNLNIGNRLKSRLENCFATDSNTFHNLRVGNGLSEYRPAPGAEIYVSPECPVAIDDIRHNYRLKTKPDAGDCNVINPARYVWSHLCDMIAVFPQQRVMFASTEADIFKKAQKVFPNVREDDMLLFRTVYLYFVPDPANIYRSLLDGSLKKPCINVSRLNLSTGNSLNTDLLCMACNLSTSPSNFSDFILQLNTINQCSWRSRPGTMNVFRHIIRGNHAAATIRRSPSRFSKAVNAVMSEEFPSGFADADDYSLSVEFLTKLMDMKPTMFVSLDTLLEKLRHFGVSPDLFCSIFSSIVKITPKKEYDDAQD